MDDIVFNSLQELYKRVEPALKTKTDEIKRLGYSYIKPEDIWNYLRETNWQKRRNLELHQLVDDILNSDVLLIDDYLKEKLNRGQRKIYFEEKQV